MLTSFQLYEERCKMKFPILCLAALAAIAIATAIPCSPSATACDGQAIAGNDLGFDDIVSLRVDTRAVRPSSVSTRGLTTGQLVRQTVISPSGEVSYRMVPQQRIMGGSSSSFRPSIQVLRRPASIERGPAVLLRRDSQAQPAVQSRRPLYILE